MQLNRSVCARKWELAFQNPAPKHCVLSHIAAPGLWRELARLSLGASRLHFILEPGEVMVKPPASPPPRTVQAARWPVRLGLWPSF